jgi:hypothetical protein
MKALFEKMYTKKEWIFIKIPFFFFWISLLQHILNKGYQASLSKGLCELVNCSFFLQPDNRMIVLLISWLLGVLYVAEIKIKWITFGLFLMSMIIYSAEESSGVLSRSGMFSFIFFAQSVAYWIYHFDNDSQRLWKNRIQFSMQAVAIAYFLSACSKLIDSGISWPFDGQRITLQIVKSFNYNWVTNLDTSQLDKAAYFVELINQNQSIILILLSISLLLEFFIPLAVINRGYARIYGLALFVMHLGIYYFMDIVIISFLVPMIIIFINPIYCLSYFLEKTFKKINKSFKTS